MDPTPKKFTSGVEGNIARQTSRPHSQQQQLQQFQDLTASLQVKTKIILSCLHRPAFFPIHALDPPPPLPPRTSEALWNVIPGLRCRRYMMRASPPAPPAPPAAEDWESLGPGEPPPPPGTAAAAFAGGVPRRCCRCWARRPCKGKIKVVC